MTVAAIFEITSIGDDVFVPNDVDEILAGIRSTSEGQAIVSVVHPLAPTGPTSATRP